MPGQFPTTENVLCAPYPPPLSLIPGIIRGFRYVSQRRQLRRGDGLITKRPMTVRGQPASRRNYAPQKGEPGLLRMCLAVALTSRR